MTQMPTDQRQRLNAEYSQRREQEEAAAAAALRREQERKQERDRAEAARAGDQQLAAAEADLKVKARAASDARTAANYAHSAVKAHAKAHALRADRVHAGVDKATARAEGALHAKLMGLRRFFAHEDAQVSPSELAALAPLFVAARPEFAAALHELLDRDVPRGQEPLSRITPEQFDAELARLREAAREADEALQQASAEHERAAQIRTAVDLGQMPRNR